MGIDNVADITPRLQYIASAAQTAFDYNFSIFTSADLVVVVDGVTKALDTDYTVSRANEEDTDTTTHGGTVTFLTPMTGGEIVTIYRDIVIERDTDIQQNGPWSSTAYNDEQDKTYLLLQQIQANVDRSLRIPIIAEVASDDIVLEPANYANKYLTFDSDGKPTPAALSSSVMTQTTIGNLLYPRTFAEIAAGVTPTYYYYPPGDVRRYGAAGDGSTDDRQAFNDACQVMKITGGTVTCGVTKTYAINPASGAILIPSNVIIDLCGSTVKRVGVNITGKMFTNEHYGVSQDSDIGIINGKIQGTGVNTTGVSDQGACIGFYFVDKWLIENIETIDSNGDGIQYREAHRGKLKNIIIGNFGRNGISPTSGLKNIWENVRVDGTAFTGANPGKSFDAENNSSSELSETLFLYCYIPDMTFVDFYTAAAGTFAHKAKFVGCRIGPGWQALRIKSTNATVTNSFHVDDATTITTGVGTANAAAVTLDNVSGVRLDCDLLDDGTANTHYGVVITNAVTDLHMKGLRAAAAFSYGLLAFNAADVLTSARIRGCELGNVYVTGSNNLFEDSNIANVTVSRAASTGNEFGPTCRISGSTTMANSAVLGSQTFATPQSWTPVLTGTGTAGAGTYVTQTGTVVKVGKLVTFTCELTWSAHTGAGDMTVTGLPYTAGGSGAGRWTFPIQVANVAWTAANQLIASIEDGTATILLQQMPIAGGAIAAVPLDTAMTVRISGSYVSA